MLSPSCIFCDSATSAGTLDLSAIGFSAYLFSLVPQSHLQFTQSISDADCRHHSALGASHSNGALVRTCTCHQTTVPCTGMDSDDRKIHCILKNTQFPIKDNMTLTCPIIFKGWSIPIANNRWVFNSALHSLDASFHLICPVIPVSQKKTWGS